jgi:hypothetical protein
VPRLISFGRTDDNAAKFYLAAAGIGYDTEVAGMLRKIEQEYRGKNRDDALANRLFKVIEEKRIPALDKLPEKFGGKPEDWGEQEDDGTLRLEVAGDDGDESLNRHSMDEAGRTTDTTLDSTLYSWLQRLIAGGRAPLGGGGKYLRLILIAVVVVLIAYFSQPVWKRAASAFSKSKSSGAGQTTEQAQQSEKQKADSLQGKYSIQVAALGDSSRAIELTGRLSGRGLSARIDPTMAGGRSLYRVRLGMYDSEKAAELEAGKLLADGVIDEWQVVEASH